MPATKSTFHAVAAVAIALMLVVTTLPVAAQTTSSPVSDRAYDPDSLLAIKPEFRQDIAASLPGGLTEYEIDVEIPEQPDHGDIIGSQRVTYTNTSGENLRELPFRLYANSATPEHDAVTIEQVMIDGVKVETVLSVDDSVATVTLPATLSPNDQVELDMEFTTRIPTDSARHYGIFNYASRSETWSLAHWYPVVAGRDPDEGWMLKPTSVYGDPIFTDAGLYTVNITAPEHFSLITSGVETVSESADGSTNTTFNAWPSRDFVIVADADMRSVSADVAGTTVTSWSEPGHDSAGDAVLEWTVQALDQFNGLLGEYPFLELHAVEVDIPNAAGVEFPQLFSVDRGYYTSTQNLNAPGHFEFTVAHEVVHQWFYSIVGNNQYDHAFIDEGLTNYLSARIYFDEHWGADAGDEIVHRNLYRPFENAVEASTDPIVDFPTDSFPTQMSYVVAAYSKAPLGFGAIHEAMGDDAFFGALRSYIEDFGFRVATPADMLAAFEGVTDIEIAPIWSHWFRERNGALDIRD